MPKRKLASLLESRTKRLSALGKVMAALASGYSAAAADTPPGALVGMYIHQHWPYNYPYAARTWLVEDYRGYCGALKALGYNCQNVWGWPKLSESLGRLHSPSVDKLLGRDILNPADEQGTTPFEKVANSLKRHETCTPELIQALNETSSRMR